MNRLIHNTLAGLGAVSLASGLTLGVGLWWLTNGDDQSVDSALISDQIRVSPVAERIAAQLAPSLQTLAIEHKDAVIAGSGGPVTRLAVRTVYPAGVKAVPYATQVGCDRALTYLDGLSVAQLIGLMSEHARAKGHSLDPTVARLAEPR